METIQIKTLNSEEDLTKLIAGDIVEFGVWRDKCLVYNYPRIKADERFFISRLENYRIPNGIGVIFNLVKNLEAKNRYFRLKLIHYVSQQELESFEKSGKSLEEIGDVVKERLPKTPDGIFHYGVNLLIDKAENLKNTKYVNPKKFAEFDKALREARL